MFEEEKNNFLELDSKIECLGLSNHIIRALKVVNIDTVGDLIKKEEVDEIRKIRNIGPKAVNEIRKALIEKCNIRSKRDISELEKLGLSNRSINVLINKFEVNNLKDLLLISLNKRDYYHLDVENKSDKEIIDKVHSLGYKFECEIKREVTLSTKLHDTLIFDICPRLSGMSVGELLKLSLDPKEKKSLYRIRGIGLLKGRKIVDIMHSYGFLFECENELVQDDNEIIEEEKQVKKLEVTDSIYDLGYYPLLTRNMIYYGISTIEDLLKLSTNEFITFQERGLYNIRGFGKNRVLHLMNYVHNLGFVFEDEKAIFERNNTLENLYRTFDSEFISREFYEKIEVSGDFEKNSFVLFFIRTASNVCINEYNGKYTTKEIIIFLNEKLIEHKRKMLCLSNNIVKKLELRK